ncbi:MAG: hypothetical protein JSS87_10315 [Acidobacteria bacterium]|nr:hypothetical protein [Acidobacteriota bacterium]
MRQHPGEIFGYFAHAHPFLEGNGRTILTLFSEQCRRAGFYVRWDLIEKNEFLHLLTEELQKPGSALDALVLRYAHQGKPFITEIAEQMHANFHR